MYRFPVRHPVRRPVRHPLHVGAAALALALAAPGAASGIDLVPGGIRIIQDLSLTDPTTVAGRPAFVRLGVINPGATEDLPGVDAIMRVFVDGQEAPESPVYSLNGPFVVPRHAIEVEEDSRLNFLYIPPENGDVDLHFEINPPGPNRVEEEDFSNNFTQALDVAFECRRALELVYVPIDYRPGGGDVPNLPDEEHIKPGIGDGFLRGIYPAPDWSYHAIPGLELLWTQNVNSSYTELLSTLSSIRENTIPGEGWPEPDYIYGWLPGNPYGGNGVANGVPGDAAFGNTETIRHQRTFAHEQGHLLGMFHNTRRIDTVGVDVEHHLLDTEGLERMKSDDKWDIMVAGLLTQEAWIDEISSDFVSLQTVFDCNEGFAGDPRGPALHVTGIVDTATGSVALDPVMKLSSPKTPTPSVGPGGTLRIDAYTSLDPAARSVHSVTLDTMASAESCTASRELRPSTALKAIVPATGGIRVAAGPDGSPVVRITVTRLTDGAIVAAAIATPNAPQASFIHPPENASIDDVLRVSWTGFDADDDPLQYNVLYSPDGQRFVPLVVRSTKTEVDVPLDRLPASSPEGALLRLMATDGMNTTIVERPLSRVGTRGGTRGGLGARGGEPNRPEVHLITPNDASEHAFGATVVLRAAAWDLEDLALDGPAIVWTSSRDGEIGTGRLTSVADLSVGTHTLTATATDLDGLSDSASIDVTVIDRALPGLTPCDGDANGDGQVDPLDSGFVLARFGCPVGTGDPDCDAADQNGDGEVNPLDSGFVLARFGECP